MFVARSIRTKFENFIQPLSVTLFFGATLLSCSIAVGQESSAIEKLQSRLQWVPPIGRSINSLSQDCLMFVAGERYFGQASINKAVQIARVIASRSDEDQDGELGWGMNLDESRTKCPIGAWTSVDGASCHRVGMPFTYHTGLAITCLARTAVASGDQGLLDVATKAALHSMQYGSQDTPCKGCFTYWRTYGGPDKGRYIRNMNAVMGMGLAWLYHATGDERFHDRAIAVLKAEKWEMENGNRGYFSIADEKFRRDPKTESERTENHLPLVAKSVLDMALLLNEPSAINDAITMMRQWMNCTNTQCENASCTSWSGNLSKCKIEYNLYSCWLKNHSAEAKRHCMDAMAQTVTWTNLAIWLALEP